MRRLGSRLAYRVLPYRLRALGRPFRAWSTYLRSLEGASEAEVRRRQHERLREIVALAYASTDFYRELYDAAGFHPRSLRAPEDLARIPRITKEHVRAHARRMVRRDLDPDALDTIVTSGTTGRALSLYTDATCAQRELASIFYMWSRVGYQPGEGRVELRAVLPDHVPFAAIRAERVLRINVNTLGQGPLGRVLDAIERSGYRSLHGYPSAIDKFCRLLSDAGLVERVRPPERILLASEVLYDRQKDVVRRTFPESRLFAHYGQGERVAQAGWFGGREIYHFTAGYGVVERDAETGAIVGTSLANEVMPLIRYELTDVCDGYREGACADAPFLFPVVERIEGRAEDYVYRPDGELIPPAVVTFPFKHGDTFTACKLIQHELDRIEIVAEACRPPAEVRREFERVIADLRVLFGERMRFELTLTDRIPRERSGKFKWIESRLRRAPEG